jgi:hypothetical protein
MRLYFYVGKLIDVGPGSNRVAGRGHDRPPGAINVLYVARL